MANILKEQDFNENDTMRFGIFFGLLALIVLLIAGFGWESKSIQSSLLSRTQSELANQNLAWVNASMDGRDLTVRGIPPNEAAQQRATQVINSISGIRVVHNFLGVADSSPKMAEMAGLQKDNVGVSKSPIENSLLIDANLTTATLCKESLHSAFNNEKIQFQINTSETMASSNELLTRLYEASHKCKGINLTIAGYTDSQGSADLNLKLSQARATAIKSYLVKRGIAKNLLNTVGYGESKPIADNNTRSGRAKNRRIEIYIGG